MVIFSLTKCQSTVPLPWSRTIIFMQLSKLTDPEINRRKTSYTVLPWTEGIQFSEHIIEVLWSRTNFLIFKYSQFNWNVNLVDSGKFCPDLWQNPKKFCKHNAENFIRRHVMYLFVCLQGHQDEVFVLEAHPTDPHILLSAGEWFFLLSLCTSILTHIYVQKSYIQTHRCVDAQWPPD